MSTLHGYSTEASKKRSDFINDEMNYGKIDNSEKLKVGQTWHGIRKKTRYRILELTKFEAKVYIYHRLNGKHNRIRTFRKTAPQFSTLS